ncbi:MAG: hypothetical protein H0X30_11095 [Anaerolineae bacterium]|nr:hypothetical protein [Anaerolineae bacterium]
MNKANIEQALKHFQAQLPEEPEWVIMVRTSGEFVGRIGEYHFFYPQAIDDSIATLWTHAHGIHILETLDHLNHGGLDYSMTFGGNRTFFLFHLNYAFFLGITYNGVKSFDAIIVAVLMNIDSLLEAINPSTPT